MRRLMLLLVLVFAGCDYYQAVPQHSPKPDMEGGVYVVNTWTGTVKLCAFDKDVTLSCWSEPGSEWRR